MLSSLISERVGAWFAQPDCPAKHLIDHILKAGFFRDAQVEAIKTYLFLKLQGGNRPLHELFCDGTLLAHEDLSRLNISVSLRELLEQDEAARTLFAFSRVKSPESTKTLLPALENYLLDHAAEVNCDEVIRRIFYGVEYPDYLFSLPMGAGKTYLMAAFIYLDLYFAQLNPDDKTFAHNFILLVPSGLKSSIVPSLKTIETFNPQWILPEPAASEIQRLIRFEILDQPKSAKKSNKARNPNAQKISQYQPFADMMGLILVTNAEKVVLEQVKLDAQQKLIEDTDDEKDKAANELRHLIGKIPNLQILIDEVHHAATDDIKLRQVVNRWHRGGTINGVLGFSGTPYLSSAERVPLTPQFSVAFSQITNTVFYYPLTRAIQTFLKKPTIVVPHGLEPRSIVREGVKEFLAQYGSKTYQNGQTAKLAIYCGTIERLEEDIYPLLIEEFPEVKNDILKYHRGNKEYPAPPDAEMQFRILDSPLSRKRIVLLVQIGKEGWDCRSLTGVILSQKGDCPTNMTLQTSCRCLRQMDGGTEYAGIWLNADNEKTLRKQLMEQQHTTIEEINRIGKGEAPPMRPRRNRTDILRLPPVAFYQLRVRYDGLAPLLC
jgi:type III restriction enzyme